MESDVTGETAISNERPRVGVGDVIQAGGGVSGSTSAIHNVSARSAKTQLRPDRAAIPRKGAQTRISKKAMLALVLSLCHGRNQCRWHDSIEYRAVVTRREKKQTVRFDATDGLDVEISDRCYKATGPGGIGPPNR